MEAISGGGGIGRPLLVFTLLMVLLQGILAGIGFAFPNFEMPGSFGIIVTVVSALMAGQSFAKSAQREPSKAERGRFGLIATLIALALSAGAFLALFAYYKVPVTPGNIALVLTGDEGFVRDIGGWLWVILGVGVLVTFAVTYFGLGSGAKGWLKRQAKLAARG